MNDECTCPEQCGRPVDIKTAYSPGHVVLNTSVGVFDLSPQDAMALGLDIIACATLANHILDVESK